jgi:alanine racemase
MTLVGRSAPALSRPSPRGLAVRPDPWLEIETEALAQNARAVSGFAGGRPLLAVVKNNAYGLAVETAGPILERQPAVAGLAVVRAEEALRLRRAGVRKPVLLMASVSGEEALELVEREVHLAATTEQDGDLLLHLARQTQRPVPVHLYVDTGMHRMGMPHHRVLAWLDRPGLRDALRIDGTFTELTEDQDFDRVQVQRLLALAQTAAGRGVSLGRLHAAASDAVLRPTPETFLDLVRPGLTLYGGYPTEESWRRAGLRPAYRLKARVLRVDRLEAGEGVSYHRRWRAQQPTWTATLGIGHVDGYPAGAVRGCEVMIRNALYPVIGTVSASHTIVALGSEAPVEVGDEAILVGPDHPALHPNEVARRSGWSEYNMFMHLNPLLDRRVV